MHLNLYYVVATYLDLDACIYIECAYHVPYSDCPAHCWGCCVESFSEICYSFVFRFNVLCWPRVSCDPNMPTPQRQLLTIHKQHTVTINIGGRLSNMFTARSFAYSSPLTIPSLQTMMSSLLFSVLPTHQ